MATTYEIAKACGVSQPTVSRILAQGSASKRHSGKTRQKVLKAAERLGYRPNAAARAIGQGRFHAIALLLGLDPHCSNVPPAMLRGITETLTRHDITLSLLQLSDDDLSSEQTMPRLLRESSSDGLLIDYTHDAPGRLSELVQRHDIPAIWVNNPRDTDCVRPNDHDAARRATTELLNRGHQRIAFVDVSYGPDYRDPHYSLAERRRGYTEAMQEAGLTPMTVGPKSGTKVDGPQRVAFCRALMEASDRPTAVVGYADSVTMPLYTAALQLGLSVPDDLSFISFADESLWSMGLVFSTMLIPQREIGQTATETLLRKIDHPDEPLSAHALPFEFEPGETIAGPGV